MEVELLLLLFLELKVMKQEIYLSCIIEIHGDLLFSVFSINVLIRG